MSTHGCASSPGEALLSAFAYAVSASHYLPSAHRSTGEKFGGQRSARKALHGHNEAFLCSNDGQHSRGSHGTWTYAFDKAHKIGAIHSAGRQG